MTVIQVQIPGHLASLADAASPVDLEVSEPVTLGGALDALEAAYPALRGTVRNHGGGPRRPFIRFFACEEDLSFEPWDALLPGPVVAGAEPLLVVGSIAGG